MKNDKPKKIISHLGQTIETTFFQDISEKDYNYIVEQMYAKPNLESVNEQIRSIYFNGTIRNDLITDYYFKDLMHDTKIYYNKWSISEMLKSKELVGHFFAKIKSNEKVYPKDQSLIFNFKTALRIGGKSTASQVSNFPLDIANMILDAYNTNGNYYDFSCGWGVRLTSAMQRCLNYYGTDPNYKLVERLNDYAQNFKKQTLTRSNVKIYCQGSETFIQELENKIGLAFSSPPYFYLEDYKWGNQSYKQGTTYEQWLNNYMKPTIENIYKYLTNDGYFCMNINDFDKFKLVEDVKRIAIDIGFKLFNCIKLSNIQRINSDSGLNDNSEKIMIFVKPNHPKFESEHDINKVNKLGQMSLFDD